MLAITMCIPLLQHLAELTLLNKASERTKRLSSWVIRQALLEKLVWILSAISKVREETYSELGPFEKCVGSARILQECMWDTAYVFIPYGIVATSNVSFHNHSSCQHHSIAEGRRLYTTWTPLKCNAPKFASPVPLGVLNTMSPHISKHASSCT
jgi:hypothetical protein